MTISRRIIILSVFTIPLLTLAAFNGCQSAGERTSGATGAPEPAAESSDVLLGVTGLAQPGEQPAQKETRRPSKGFAQLWTENCIRCHNSRDPRTYTDAEWTVAMHHMRVRANLTAEEHRAILEYLKASN